MNKQLRFAGFLFVLGLVLGFGYWQQQGQAAGNIGNEFKQLGNKLKQFFSPAVASKTFRPASFTDPAAPVATITVTSLADGAANAANCPGANCRLRDAIAKAVDGDTIDFSVTGTITLTNSQLDILKDLTINGPGPTQLTVSGNGASRVFYTGGTVALSGMTIANGIGVPGGNPGGIYNFRGLTLTNCTLSGNQDGGIYNDTTGTLTITGSTLSGNSGDFGGAIGNFGTAILTNCTLSGNSAAYGAGLYDLGTATLTNCTVSGNSVTHRGGGIAMDYGGNMTLTNCTVSGNSAGLEGGGIFNNDTSINGDLKIKNMLIAGNSGTNSRPDVYGKLNSQGYNLIGDNTGAAMTPTTGDQIGTAALPINPLLGPLANNGGPTQTHALLSGSVAFNAGDNCVLTNSCASNNLGFNLTTDQRGAGFNRQVSSAVDIGAFESPAFTLALSINPATLPAGAFGSAYNQTLSATGGSGNYSFILSRGLLPPGLTLSATGQISGTPTSRGSFPVTVVVRDNSHTDNYGTRNYTLAVPFDCAPVPSGLVDWWRAEGNANDAVGSNHGTLQGSASISTAAEGQVGQAFKFNGTNGYVALPDNLFDFPTAGSATNPFSFELWFKSAASGGVILGQQDVAPYNTPAGNVPAIYVGTDGKLRVEMFWNGAANPLVSASTVNDNLVFHHLVITYNYPPLIVYLDGQVMGSQTQVQKSYSASYKYQLGTGNTSGWPGGSAANGGWFNFTGLIDEPSLYNRDLTAQEVQALYAAHTAGKCFNPPPGFAPAAAISRQQGSPAGAAVTVGTVSGGQTAVGSLTVTQIAGGTATGITVTGISNTNGTITALVSAACTATSGTVRFQVSDGSVTGTGDLTVNITANTVPALTYGAASASAGGSTSNSPTTASDNGSITGYTVQSQGTYTGTISVNASGVVSLSNAAPVGIHTITIRTTDNCNATTDATVTLTVGNNPPTITAGAALSRQQGNTGSVSTIATVSDGETAPGSLVVTATTVPTGITVISITNAAGTIIAHVAASCTATIGANTVVLTVTDGNDGTATANLTVNVSANTAPTLTFAAASVSSGASTTNTPTTATDNGSITGYAVQSQGTYTGTISANSSGVVSISNAAPVGAHTITIRATDNCGATNDATFTLTVSNNAPTFTPAAALSRQQGSPAGVAVTIGTVADAQTATGSLTLTQITGGTATGITFANITNINGTITAQVSASCTATAGTVRFQVSDGSLTGTGDLQVNVMANTAPTLNYAVASVNTGASTTNSPATASDNGSISSYAIQSQGTYTGTISVNSSGVVSISNAAPIGAHTITIRATDNCNVTTDATFTLTVNCPAITLSALPDGAANAAYNQTVSVMPAGTYSFAVTSGALPTGLTLNASSGAITGTATASGAFSFRITATGSGAFGSCSGLRDYSISTACGTVTLNPASLPNGSLGTAYNQTVAASPVGSYSYAVTLGSLPSGLTLNAASGAITGTPAAGGSYSFTITASSGGAGGGAGACSGSRQYTVDVGCATITLPTLASATAGNAYSQSAAASPAGSYTYSLTQGSLPSGLSLNAQTCLLSGMPSVTGTYNFTIKAQAASGCSGMQAYTFVISCPAVVLNPASLPDGVKGTAYSQTLSASPAGGNYTLAVTSGALPGGLSLNPSTGGLSGTPTVNGTFNFTVTATGSGGCTGSRSYAITVGGGGCPTILLPDPPSGTVGQMYSQSVAASPVGGYSYSQTGTLPPGLTLYATGLLFGYPTSTGTYNFTVTATDGNNCTGSKSYSLVIGGAGLARAVFGDFDGDGKTDFSVWRGLQGDWLIIKSSDSKLQTARWGAQYDPYNDVIAPGDYDGDGKFDAAVFRRGLQKGQGGQWLIKGSKDGSVTTQVWGIASDTPVPADYDGDGKTDIAVWRGAETNWYIQRSSDHQVEIVSWGTSDAPYRDVPVPADYDGDGKTDIAVFRQSNGHWYIRQSSDGQVIDKHWGFGTDVPVVADYDGDGKADIAVWRGSETNWYIQRSSDGQTQTVSWGGSWLGDVPVPGDYDGDGKTDIAVWREPEGIWYVKSSRDDSVMIRTQGAQGDRPVNAMKNN